MKLPYKIEEYKVDRDAFDQVVKEIESGTELNCQMLGSIFGQPFWILMMLVLVDTRKDLLRTIASALEDE